MKFKFQDIGVNISEKAQHKNSLKYFKEIFKNLGNRKSVTIEEPKNAETIDFSDIMDFDFNAEGEFKTFCSL